MSSDVSAPGSPGAPGTAIPAPGSPAPDAASPAAGSPVAAAPEGPTISVGRRWSPMLASVSAFVLTPFLFTPARIFIGNVMEFTSMFGESMRVFLAVSLGLVVALFAVLLAVSWRRRGCRVIVAVLTASAFLMWLQASVLLWPYGVLNGQDIPWDAMMRYGFIDGTVWAVVLAFALMKNDLVFRASRLLSVVLVVVQLLSVGWSWIGMPKDQDLKRRQREAEADTLYRFSEHVNVIVMVLDTFQSDFFQDIIGDDAELRASFEGFTYFRNALAGSDGTIVSVPNMLTGTNYDNSQPYLEYVRASFLGNSLPKTLKEYGFAVDLYPMIWYSVYDDFSGVAPTGARLKNRDAFLEEQAFIADLALFRCVPHFAKEYFYRGQRWLLKDLAERRLDARDPYVPPAVDGEDPPSSPAPKYAREFDNLRILLNKNRDPKFIDAVLRTSTTMERSEAFKFYHLKGIHLPLFMNEDCAYDETLEPVREDMLRQGRGTLKIAAMFLEKLKQMRVYDDSLIFIVGDHGSGVGEAKINVSPYGDRFNTRGPYRGNFSSFKAAGIPLILAKRIGAAGELRVSDAPVCLGDIPQTVAEELGLQASFPGRSMFAVGEDERRERIYRGFVGSQEDPVYLAPLYEYAVDGFSWDDTSWRETGNVYYAPK